MVSIFGVNPSSSLGMHLLNYPCTYPLVRLRKDCARINTPRIRTSSTFFFNSSFDKTLSATRFGGCVAMSLAARPAGRAGLRASVMVRAW